MHSRRPLREDLILVYVALEALLHGVLYPLPAHEGDGAFADIHAAAGDALEVVDYQGRSLSAKA
jgi:hypothetical protein